MQILHRQLHRALNAIMTELNGNGEAPGWRLVITMGCSPTARAFSAIVFTQLLVAPISSTQPNSEGFSSRFVSYVISMRFLRASSFKPRSRRWHQGYGKNCSSSSV